MIDLKQKSKNRYKQVKKKCLKSGKLWFRGEFWWNFLHRLCLVIVVVIRNSIQFSTNLLKLFYFNLEISKITLRIALTLDASPQDLVHYDYREGSVLPVCTKR